MENKNIILKNNRRKVSDEIPQYTIQYNSKQPLDLGKKIISSIINKSDIIYAVHTSQFSSAIGNKERFITSLIEIAQANSIEYQYRKIHMPRKESIFGRLFSSGSLPYEHELYFYIPYAIWLTNTFDELRSTVPVRYYVLNEGVVAADMLNTLVNMLDSEKANLCNTTIFDWPAIGQMGIISDSLSYDSIHALVEEVKFSS